MIQFRIKPKEVRGFLHYWEMCIGSSNAYTALREDYRKQLKRAHEELGFRYVRFHGILDDRMSVLIDKKDHFGNSLGKVYNFSNIDNIYDWLIDNHMKPFIELGFMPSAIASGERTVFHYKGNITPPKYYSEWEELIRRFLMHLIDRYGIEEVRSWYFEVWNEPNLFFFFDGDKKEYLKLYTSTVKTIKSVDNELKVGGPATSCNYWIKDIVDYCTTNSVPLDFISTHHYPTDDPLWQSGMDVTDFFKSESSRNRKYHRGILTKMAKKVKEEAGSLPVFFTEWNISAMNNDAQHDESYAAAMVAKTLADNDGLVDGYSFWTFSDIFEENGQLAGAFHGGFGLQTYAGIAKPVYRLFELYHGLGDKRLGVESSSPGSTVEMIATKKGNSFRLIIYNYNIQSEPISSEQVSINLSDIDEIKAIRITRIDDKHANAKALWVSEGAPEYLSREMVKRLHNASELYYESLNMQSVDFSGELKMTIPEHGVISIDIEV